MAETTIIGLDLGSSCVRVAVAQPLPGEDGKPRLHIIGAVPCRRKVSTKAR